MSDDTEIKNGIEWWEDPQFPGCHEASCARCGSSADFTDCWSCGGEGFVEHPSWDGCGEDYEATCDICNGNGGWWRCISDREWCEAHPLLGREHIKSTALSAEAKRSGE